MPINTKAVIAETLRTMATEQDIDKITVTDLVAKCGISRQTFYYHFQDITEVVEYSVQQSVEKAVEEGLNAETAEKAIRAFVEMRSDIGSQAEHILSSQRGREFTRILIEGMETYLRKMIRYKSPKIRGSVDTDVALWFCACGLAGVLARFACEKDIDVEQGARNLYEFLEWLQQ